MYTVYVWYTYMHTVESGYNKHSLGKTNPFLGVLSIIFTAIIIIIHSYSDNICQSLMISVQPNSTVKSNIMLGNKI